MLRLWLQLAGLLGLALPELPGGIPHGCGLHGRLRSGSGTQSGGATLQHVALPGTASDPTRSGTPTAANRWDSNL